MTILRGVDGCPAGWLCASLDLDTGRISAQVFARVEMLLGGSQAAATGIDIPIGLPGSRPRRCDEEARRLLGARASSVFPAPARACLDAHSYEAACAASATACGKRLSRQTYAILPKIREIDALLRDSPALQARVFEVHPEVSFCFWNMHKPMRYSKRSGFGFVERYRLAQEAFGTAADEMRLAVPAAQASDADILDALAALWTARRIHARAAVRLPAVEERDDRGLPMRILA